MNLFKKIKKSSFRMKFVMMFILIIASIMIIMAGIVQKFIMEPLIISSLEANAAQMQIIINKSFPGDWEIINNKIVKGGQEVTNDFLDSLTKTTKARYTVFIKDVRQASSVVRKDGSRPIGVPAMKGVWEMVSKRKIFNDKADVAGESMQTIYFPIQNKNGEIIGMLFTGVSRSVIFHFMLYLVLVFFITGTIGMGFFWFVTTIITQKVEGVVEEIYKGIDDILTESDGISSSANSLAADASKSASAVQETSSTIEQISSMAKKNANNTNTARNLMKELIKSIKQADGLMKNLKNSMEQINTTSDETKKIIKTIDEIAFQTSLLALNAAVEAARAGEAGAGFAVVADEVRNLAMRSAEAAKTTTELIENSGNVIKDGFDLVIKTDEVFTKTSTDFKKVGEIIEEISSASEEQSKGVDFISNSAAQIDDASQNVAAGSEQMAAATLQIIESIEKVGLIVTNFLKFVKGSSQMLSEKTKKIKQDISEREENLQKIKKLKKLN